MFLWHLSSWITSQTLTDALHKLYTGITPEWNMLCSAQKHYATIQDTLYATETADLGGQKEYLTRTEI